jgi:hypothetical protein
MRRSGAAGLSALAALVVLGGGLCPVPAEAGTFRFEDENGAVHYTNVPTDPRYQLHWSDPAAPRAPSLASGASTNGMAAYAETIRLAAERYRVDRRLVEAVIQVESGGNPQAVSPKGAQGLMQLMPQRAAELGVANPFNPLQNVDGGVRHLRDLLQRFAGNVTLALAAYNAGEGAVRTYQGVPPFAETRDYIRKVRALYDGETVVVERAGGAVGSAPQTIYQEITNDGTVTFTNLPPRPALTLPRRL